MVQGGENPEFWGSIDDLLKAQPENVPADATWFSVILSLIFLPLNLIQGILAGLIPRLFVVVSIGLDCCLCLCSAMSSVLKGRPLYLAFTWWRYTFAGLTALISNKKSRLSLFLWEWNAFGSGDWWWHGEGCWSWKWEQVNELLMRPQARKKAFGAVSAPVPDLFASDLVIFLPNLEDPTGSLWQVMRDALHTFLDNDGATYKDRLEQMPTKLQTDWPNPSTSELNDVPKLRRIVAKCVFWMIFGKWLDDEDATMLANWRNHAFWFVLPRLVQRTLMNIGIRKVKKLRKNSVELIERLNLQELFVTINEGLPQKHRRENTVKLCDEIMYAIGFAGIGGTSACVESCGAFLLCEYPAESATDKISFGHFNTSEKMIAKYKEDPEKYIKETCRMDPPVTSATTSFAKAMTVTLAGRKCPMPAGLLHQYALSVANRDPTVFTDPETFNPDRAELDKALTWNGRFKEGHLYPRICPGRFLSMDIAMAILNHVINPTDGPEATNKGGQV